MRRLLLISCSVCKHTTPGFVRAIERYNGMVYKVIKKARRESYWPENTDVLIISAKYGLISEDIPIELYDQKMDKPRANELQKEICDALDYVLQINKYDKVFINMGNIYMHIIFTSSEMKKAFLSGIVQEAVGEIGMRLSQTKKWIEEEYSEDFVVRS